MQHLKLTGTVEMAISSDERAFFVALGARIAELRKTQGITQTQMAEALGASQQTINSYEVGRRRIPVSALPPLARMLDTSIDELLLRKQSEKYGLTPKLRQQMEHIGTLPSAKQKFITEILETLLKQQA